MNHLLRHLARYGDIGWLSYHFAKFIAAQSGLGIDDLVCLSAALVCEANQQGSVCIDLSQLGNKPLFGSTSIDAGHIQSAETPAAWQQRLLASSSVGRPGETTPLTLDGMRLYLNRFWFYEDFLARKILHMLESDPGDDRISVAELVESMFAQAGGIDQDQKNAIVIAASRLFCVISGGPGSGKTSTVIRLLSVLLTQNPECRIAIAAPTGKAAARMIDAIHARVDQLEIDARLKSLMPDKAQTIHRLLRYRRQGFEYNEQHRLPVDCVIIDEASMIDLKLMFHLVSALPNDARLILLGDRDQLSSVAAGNVLGDITGHGHEPDYDSGSIEKSIALLRSNYRFNQDSAIAELSSLINQGKKTEAIELLQQNERGLHWYKEDGNQINVSVLRWIDAAYQTIFECETPELALKVYQSTRVLCTTNRGPLGIESINRGISRVFQQRNQMPESDRYHGLPIMITRNHQQLELFNGDTGILWDFGTGLRACFLDSEGGIRDLAVNRLPTFTPAWASTVHKSQGSEFDSVLLILPSDPDSEVLSRELLYTAVTRAREQFVLHASVNAVYCAVESFTRRHSGLAQRLGWPDQTTPPGPKQT